MILKEFRKINGKLKITLETYVAYVTLISNVYGGDSMANLNLRDVPNDLHRKAKVKAAMDGISLKALVIKALEEYLKIKKR